MNPFHCRNYCRLIANESSQGMLNFLMRLLGQSKDDPSLYKNQCERLHVGLVLWRRSVYLGQYEPTLFGITTHDGNWTELIMSYAVNIFKKQSNNIEQCLDKTNCSDPQSCDSHIIVLWRWEECVTAVGQSFDSRMTVERMSHCLRATVPRPHDSCPITWHLPDHVIVSRPRDNWSTPQNATVTFARQRCYLTKSG